MKLTVLIISYRSLEKLRNCVKTIGKNREIIIIENSDNTQIKKVIENEYTNCKVILNNCNLGYSKASNIGFKLINTEYAFLLNTDIIINENQINQIEKEIVELDDSFTLASPFSDDLIDFNRNNKIDKFFSKNRNNFDDSKKNSKIDLVKGCSLIVNLKKFVNKDVFDNNYFFFFEEMDLCRKVIKNNENIYLLNQIKIEHKSAQSLDKDLDIKYHNFRHWNYFWGRFYYFKKNYGYIYALTTHLSKLIRFSFNMIKYYLISKPQYYKNKYRFLGLFNSIIGKPSISSVKILEE